jgi:hypothetical protein
LEVNPESCIPVECFLTNHHILDRVFYETLLSQVKDSKMAQDWCLAYGILEWKKAEGLVVLDYRLRVILM